MHPKGRLQCHDFSTVSQSHLPSLCAWLAMQGQLRPSSMI